MAIQDAIRDLANKYAQELEQKISARVIEMVQDDKSHYLLYNILGINDDEGEMIDVYQNKGRLLYNAAGNFLEEATIQCFIEKFPQTEKKKKIPNSRTPSPKTFEIDCLVGTDAIELKWRDATTDGDHKKKEETRIHAIKDHGYKPIRVMFYSPNRKQAIKTQNKLKTLYETIGGEFYAGDSAWDYIQQKTNIDLKAILLEIAGTSQNKEGK